MKGPFKVRIIFLIPKKPSSHILVHAIDKHEEKKNYSCEKI